MTNSATSTLGQLELQGKVCEALERFCAERGLPPSAVFDLLVAFAWGRARLLEPTTPSDEFSNRMRAACIACDLAHQKAVQHVELAVSREGVVMMQRKRLCDVCQKEIVAGTKYVRTGSHLLSDDVDRRFSAPTTSTSILAHAESQERGKP